MNFPFYKLTVGKNDFILINLMGEAVPDEALLPRLSRSICRRHRGVGANGLLVLLDHPEAGAAVRFFNRKGTEVETFFDPLLGTARYLFDSGFSGTRAFTLWTPRGIRSIEAIDSANFRITLGVPGDGEAGELKEMIATEGGSFLSIQGKTFPVTPVELSRFFGVLFSDSPPESGKKSIARRLRKAGLFSRKFTPLFVQVYSDDDIVFFPWWSKGCALKETSLAAGAAAAAAAARGFTNRSVMTRCAGQELYIEWTPSGREILCTGGADYVFTGDFYFDENSLYGGE